VNTFTDPLFVNALGVDGQLGRATTMCIAPALRLSGNEAYCPPTPAILIVMGRRAAAALDYASGRESRAVGYRF
jgi:hypothetical protein